MALTQASEEGLKISNAGTNGQFLQKQSGNTGGFTWADVPAGVGGANGADFNDNVKVRLGTGNDLEIYHNGSNSIIKDAGTGYLLTQASGFAVQNAAGSETIMSMAENGSVDLYYDDTKRFETTSTGATITGGLTFNSAPTAAITLADNKRLYFGDGNDFWIGSNGSNGEFAGEVYVYDNMTFYDNKRLRLGSGTDLQIYHDASNSYIQNTTDTDLIIHNQGNAKIQIKPQNSYPVELYYNASKRLETDANGIKVLSSSTGGEVEMRTDGNTYRGSVYVNNSSDIGFLNSTGNWAIRVGNTTDINCYNHFLPSSKVLSKTILPCNSI